MTITDHIAASGKTRLAISAEARVSRQTLHAVEHGRAVPKIEVAVRLAAAIGCHLDVIRPDLEGIIA